MHLNFKKKSSCWTLSKKKDELFKMHDELFLIGKFNYTRLNILKLL